MPSQVLTKRRVKRRQQRLRLVSKNAKRKVRSVRKHRKTAKKVMRGGGNIITAHVVYDAIPCVKRTKEETMSSSINVPICLVLIKPKTPLDEIYLFFNKNMTSEDIKLIVKLLLGISDDFELNSEIAYTPVAAVSNPSCYSYTLSMNPTGTAYGCIERIYLGHFYEGDKYGEEVVIPKRLLRGSLGTTFVKLVGGFTYSIETGLMRQSNEQLDKVKTTRHNITQGKIVNSNGKKIKDFLKNDGPDGFKAKILASRGVLQDLYKDYFTPIIETVSVTTDEEVDTKFGKDLEGKDLEGKDITHTNGNVVKPWNKDAEPYETFKSRGITMIRERLDDTKKHNMYGLDQDTVTKLGDRPLRITEPIEMERDTVNSSIIDTLEETAPVLFTNLSKNWWTKEEEKMLNGVVSAVLTEKTKRIDKCSIEYYKNTYDCMGPGWR